MLGLYILEYSSTVWSPHLLCDINRTEMVQCRSARFVCNDFSMQNFQVLNNLNWPLLEQRRIIAKVTMFFKIINNLISIPHDHISDSRSPLVDTILNWQPKQTHICSFFPITIKLYGILYQILIVINSTILNFII